MFFTSKFWFYCCFPFLNNRIFYRKHQFFSMILKLFSCFWPNPAVFYVRTWICDVVALTIKHTVSASSVEPSLCYGRLLECERDKVVQRLGMSPQKLLTLVMQHTVENTLHKPCCLVYIMSVVPNYWGNLQRSILRICGGAKQRIPVWA